MRSTDTPETRTQARNGARQLAAQAFREAFVRVDNAGIAILKRSERIRSRPVPPRLHPHEVATFGVTVPDDMHLSLVHAWEDLFSSFYKALNTYAAFFATLADHETRRGLDTGSMKNWLAGIAQRFPDLKSNVGVLESARHHRSKWIDHPVIAGAALDWMTNGLIIHGHFLVVPIRLRVKPGQPREVIWNGAMVNPWQGGYMPPIRAEETGIPPCPFCLTKSFVDVVRATSKHFEFTWQKLPARIIEGSHVCSPPKVKGPSEMPPRGKWVCDVCRQHWQLWCETDDERKIINVYWRDIDPWVQLRTRPADI